MFQKNDLLICAPERDNEANKVFDIYARIVSVEDGIYTLDRYQKFGALRYSEARYNENTILEFYRSMTEDEKKVFADTMYSRKVIDGKIHLGGDRLYDGWEPLNGDVLETLAVLDEYQTRDKEIEEIER